MPSFRWIPPPQARTGRTTRIVLALAIAAACALAVAFGAAPGDDAAAAPPAAAKPALTVAVAAPETADWPRTLAANGSVVAWQEAVIGAEIDNFRIVEVRAQVGDRVRKGEVLARIDGDTVASELAAARAAAAELEAGLAEAAGNAARARELKEKGFYSTQLHGQYQTAEHTAAARLDAARARLAAAEVRMAKTAVTAPDDGVISAATAAVGSLTRSGEELFRLIRGGRVEWRAEVPAADLAKVQPGAAATLAGPDGERVAGRVRLAAPSVDPRTRNGLAYVDLPAPGPLRAGMFARGEIELGRAPALSLPQSAVVRREGFAYVFRLEAADGELRRVAQTKVTPGRRLGDRIEILAGVAPQDRVVAAGAGFLADGDAVRLADERP